MFCDFRYSYSSLTNWSKEGFNLSAFYPRQLAEISPCILFSSDLKSREFVEFIGFICTLITVKLSDLICIVNIYSDVWWHVSSIFWVNYWTWAVLSKTAILRKKSLGKSCSYNPIHDMLSSPLRSSIFVLSFSCLFFRLFTFFCIDTLLGKNNVFFRTTLLFTLLCLRDSSWFAEIRTNLHFPIFSTYFKGHLNKTC